MPQFHSNVISFLKKNPLPCMCYLVLDDHQLHFFILDSRQNLEPLPQMAKVPIGVSYYNEGRNIILQATFFLSDGSEYVAETEFPWDKAGHLFEMLNNQQNINFHLVDEYYRYLVTTQIPMNHARYRHFLAAFKEYILET